MLTSLAYVASSLGASGSEVSAVMARDSSLSRTSRSARSAALFSSSSKLDAWVWGLRLRRRLDMASLQRDEYSCWFHLARLLRTKDA